MPGQWGHLMARFVDVVTATGLSPGETEAVHRWVEPGPIRDAFFSQPAADQRHGFEAALAVLSRMPDRPDLLRAALLHDIGKRHAGLGPLGRVAATIALRLRLPVTPRLALYRDHGPLAAAEMAGEPALVVDFARHHHGDRPASIPPEEWGVLQAADRARPIARARESR